MLENGTWKSAASIGPEDAYPLLRPHLVSGPELLGDCERGIAVAKAQSGLASSLCLVEPEQVNFVCEPPFRAGKPRAARVVFSLESRWYDLGLTDAVVAPRLRAKSYGTYSSTELGFDSTAHMFLTISLTTPLNETHWKLVAGVLLLP